MNMKTTALAVIVLGVCFAVFAFLCFFAQDRLLEYFLQGNIRQLNFVRSHSWIYAVLGGLVVVLGIWGVVKRGSYSGPIWVPFVVILAGALLIFGHKLIAYHRYEFYSNLRIQETDGSVSWQPAVYVYTYAAGVVLSLASFVAVSAGVYNLRH